MDADIFQLPLKRFKALDHRKFDSNFIPGEEILYSIPRGPQR